MLVRRIDFTEYAVLFGEHIRCLDCKTQYAVLSRRFDMLYPTGGYGVSEQNGECGFLCPTSDSTGTIPEVPIANTDSIVAREVGAVSVISPTRVLELVDYLSSFDSDPSKDYLPAEQRPERHESLTPSSEFPLAPVVAPPGIHRRPAILVRPGEAITFGRPYLTHPNGPRKLLTKRKRVGPFSARRLTWRRIPHRSSDRHSSPDFNSNSSSSRPSTRVASSRLVDPPVRTPRCSEAFMRWRSAPFSTLYPPTTLESSPDSSSERSLDSSSPSAGPSRKRCRSPTTLVPSSTLVSRLIAPALADLPPCKRFRNSYLSEVSGEEHMEMGTADAETVANLGISEGVGAHTKDSIDLGVEVATSDIKEYEEDFEAEASAGGTMENAIDPLAAGKISEPTKGDVPDLEEASRERAGLADRVRSLGRENLRVRALLCIERDHVECLRRHMALSQEEFHQVRRDHDDTQRRLRRLESLVERRLGFRR
ncbi:hypothetical protein Tco_0939278 [Tanacetum coccineum]|uniref:Uncharacterized protein n=1 Tax=Tanacetum coccineum TaxID=301880 RepID=A0ABQ5DKJ3_9ASTR